MHGILVSLHLFLLSVGLISHKPPQSPDSVIRQTLTCRIDDRQQDMETRLTVHEDGEVTILTYSIGVKHGYTSRPPILAHITPEEAHDFMAGVKQRALAAGTITEMRHARYLMNIDITYSNQNERFWYDMSQGKNTPQVNALYQYIDNFIRRHKSVTVRVSGREYK